MLFRLKAIPVTPSLAIFFSFSGCCWHCYYNVYNVCCMCFTFHSMFLLPFTLALSSLSDAASTLWSDLPFGTVFWFSRNCPLSENLHSILWMWIKFPRKLLHLHCHNAKCVYICLPGSFFGSWMFACSLHIIYNGDGIVSNSKKFSPILRRYVATFCSIASSNCSLNLRSTSFELCARLTWLRLISHFSFLRQKVIHCLCFDSISM